MKETMTKQYLELLKKHNDAFLSGRNWSDAKRKLFLKLAINALHQFDYHSLNFNGYVEAMADAFDLIFNELHSYLFDTYYAIRREMDTLLDFDDDPTQFITDDPFIDFDEIKSEVMKND